MPYNVDLLLESVTSEITQKELDLFFKASPELQRLRDYGANQGIKFGIDRQGIFINKDGSMRHSSFLTFSQDGAVKEKIVFIPGFVAATVTFQLLKGGWLEKIIFALVHEIGHLETLPIIPKKECEFYKSSCFYKECAANERAWGILRKNKIRMKKQTFLEYVSVGIGSDPNHAVCLEKTRANLCPFFSNNLA